MCIFIYIFLIRVSWSHEFIPFYVKSKTVKWTKKVFLDVPVCSGLGKKMVRRKKKHYRARAEKLR